MSELIDTSLDYSVYNYNHSTLHYRNVAPQTAADVTLAAASVVGPTQFVISSSVFNPAKSRLNFTVSGVLTTATNFAWAQGQTLSTINRIVCYDMNTSAIFADINNAGDIYNMLSPVTNKAETLRHKSGFQGLGATAAAAGLQPYEDLTKAGLNQVNAVNQDVSGNNDYFQVQQLIPTLAAGNVQARFSIPLSAFQHTFFSIDKMIYNPSNIAIDVYWEGFGQTVFASGSQTNPTTATVEAFASATITGSSIGLSLCTEGNVNVASQIIQKVMSSGLSMPIGYVTGIKQNITSATPSLTLPLTAAYGKKILYLVTAPFIVPTAANNIKLHSKWAGALSTTNRIVNYNTFINGVPILAPAGFNGALSEDYTIANKQYLEGSCIQTQVDYNYLWCHIDNFARTRLCELDPANVDGLDVTSQQANWQIQYTLDSSTAFNHFIAVVGQKVMSITSQGATVA